MPYHVRAGQPGDVDEAADVLAEAFTGYAWATWTVAADDHTARLRAQYDLFLRHVLEPYGSWWVAEWADPQGSCLAGVAAWLSPSTKVPRETWVVLDREITRLAGDRAGHARAAEEACDGLRPDGAHWYLATVGVLPRFRGRGCATELLGPGLAAVDAGRQPAYLETSSPANVRLYERLGFDVTGHVKVADGGPDVWGMLR